MEQPPTSTMLRFFRQLRQRLLTENRFSKYLLYAIGEILLVVIGILIALQIDNWNEQRKDRITEQKILNAIHEDLEININRLNQDMALEQRTVRQATFIVDHLDNKKPYDPSLDGIFFEAMYSPDIILSATGYESLKLKGIDLIRDEILQKRIVNLYDVTYANLIAETVRLENQFWPSSVLPMVHKHFRETEFKKLKPTNYAALVEDDTYKNMVMHRVHFRKVALEWKAKALDDTKEVIELIESGMNSVGK